MTTSIRTLQAVDGLVTEDVPLAQILRIKLAPDAVEHLLFDSEEEYPEGSVGAFLIELARYRGIPRRTSGLVSGEYTVVDEDVTLNTADLAAGRAFNIYNASDVAIALLEGSGVTVRLLGTLLTGDRVIGPRGMATVLCESSTEALATGAGVS